MHQPIKIISFNVNGLRSRFDQLSEVIAKHQPDIIGLQETKVSNEEFPFDTIKSLGYEAFIHGQKGHYGVAYLTKIMPTNIQYGFPTDNSESQRRIIHGQFDINGHSLHTVSYTHLTLPTILLV